MVSIHLIQVILYFGLFDLKGTPRDRMHPIAKFLICLVYFQVCGCALVSQSPTEEKTSAVPAVTSFRHTGLPVDRLILHRPDNDVVGQVQVLLAKDEDTLPQIARRFNLGYEEIVSANPGVDPWLPGEGTEITLPTQFILPSGPRQGIVLNLASMRLFYFPEPQAGEPAEVITHPIGIGRVGWSTPVGETSILAKARDPVWYVPASVRKEHLEAGDPLPPVVQPGPDNPLGRFAMRLGIPGYLIHGTNKPFGVGMRVSHGCIRLYPEDISRLFDRVPKGTTVRIVNEPYQVGWLDGQLYLEAHTPLEDDDSDATLRLANLLAEKLTDDHPIDFEIARAAIEESLGVPLPISVMDGKAPEGTRALTLKPIIETAALE